MTSLTRFDNDGLELIIDTVTGEAFTTLSGYARMSGKAKSTISERLTVRNEDLKTAEILTQQGLRTVRLISADLVFDWLLTDNIELAKAMGKAGATIYLHQLAGYKVESKPVEVKEPSIPQIQLQGLQALETMTNTLELAKSLGNVRLMQQLEVQLSQYIDAYVSLKQLTASTQTEQEIKRYEGAIDVAIRLNKQIPSNLESSLGKFVKKTIPHLLQEVQDNRTAATSGKRLSVNMYPANHEEVENAVLAYCVLKGIK
jgi:hypothetical protein